MRKSFTRNTILAIVGCTIAANMLFLPHSPARADNDKKDGGGKKIIIVVGPVTKTHDKHH